MLSVITDSTILFAVKFALYPFERLDIEVLRSRELASWQGFCQQIKPSWYYNAARSLSSYTAFFFQILAGTSETSEMKFMAYWFLGGHQAWWLQSAGGRQKVCYSNKALDISQVAFTLFAYHAAFCESTQEKQVLQGRALLARTMPDYWPHKGSLIGFGCVLCQCQ